MKRTAAVMMSAMALFCADAFSVAAEIPQRGKLLYHNYSSYEAMDSKLYLHDFGTGETLGIGSDTFVHAMNADFGSHCYDVVFMAIDPIADEWDIFRYNTISGRLTNVTEQSGFRNEDPKFSPDGKRIVFKRGYWDAKTDGFVYDLAEMDLQTGSITMLTDSHAEESMPCYAPDGESIYYSELLNGETAICRLSLQSGEKTTVYAESGVQSYYPMLSETGLYFTKWHSATLQSDCIVRMDDENAELLPLNHPDYNCSDPFPLANGALFFSSTKNGSYDLYFYDGQQESALTALSTVRNDLGTSYYGRQEAENSIVKTTDFLLQRNHDSINMDADGNGVVDAFDLAMLKRMAG